MRLRQIGESNFITYKGPKLDATTKTRREIELPLPAGEAVAASYAELLTALGFRYVAEVRKQRRTFHLAWNSSDVEIALDEVAQLGSFVEIELSASEAQLDRAKECLASLARELLLDQSERRSYLELLIEVNK